MRKTRHFGDFFHIFVKIERGIVDHDGREARAQGKQLLRLFLVFRAVVKMHGNGNLRFFRKLG